MRVALVHAWLGGHAAGGGGPRALIQLGQGMRSLGHDVTIYTHRFEPSVDTAALLGDLPVQSVHTGSYTLAYGKRRALRSFWLEMPRLARAVGASDLIIASEWPALRAGGLAARRQDVPLVWLRHDHTIWERAVAPNVRSVVSSRWFDRIPRLVASFPDVIHARSAKAICVLDRESAELVAVAYRRRAEVIPCAPPAHFFDPVDRDDARQQFGLEDDEFVALAVGIMMPHRRFEDLLDALTEPGLEAVRAMIIGGDHVDPTYADAIADRVRALDLNERVMLQRESVGEDLLRAAYAAADIFVFPNDHRQVWGLAPLEAIGSLTPVIVTSANGVAAALHGQPGIQIVSPHSPKEIAQAIVNVKDGAIRRETLKATRDWVVAEFGGAAYARRILEVAGIQK